MSFRNLLLMGTVLLPLASRAACVEKDVVGQWEAKLVGLDKKSVIQCRLILTQGLRVSGSCLDLNQPRGSQVRNALLTLDQDCHLKMSFWLQPEARLEAMFGLSFFGTMNSENRTMIGVFTGGKNYDYGSFAAKKK